MRTLMERLVVLSVLFAKFPLGGAELIYVHTLLLH